MTKGAKTFDDLGKKLSKKLRFKKFRLRIDGRKWIVEGQINPWAVIMEGPLSGEIVEVKNVEIPKGIRKGDDFVKDGEKLRLLSVADDLPTASANYREYLRFLQVNHLAQVLFII
ncbi:hypothetical protein OO013_00780 [Mangrovivirga sp. M17]|uniref:Lipoyl-binding domain-containing protein n=1 Tax=Mangrovivirga halotolerans TaxID=2993936 RepID=A0ABT3RLV9_9BACT|nr:hypothetical protein [Mangrovivirga halotolerans]MCX2742374.1 hypothetical protein [Mangrovivirga halotolerans]